VLVHHDLFRQDELDQTWLTKVGENGWIGFSKDDAIRRRPIEIAAIQAVGAVIFIFGSANVPGPKIGLAFQVALPRIRRAVKRFSPAVIGRVNQAGEVSVMWANSVQLPRSIPIKRG
jgi:hypothetical protein